MSIHFPQNTDPAGGQNGSVLVIAVIVLAILGAIGIASLDVAELNLFVAANDRDAKEAFFHADSGANLGHEFLEISIENGNSTFYGSDATTWVSDAFNASLFPATFYSEGTMSTFIRSGALDSGVLPGSAMQIGAGYEGVGKGAAGGGTFTNYLIRSHRDGRRNSVAEVDIGWRHINY